MAALRGAARRFGDDEGAGAPGFYSGHVFVVWRLGLGCANFPIFF